jgi:multisubunit Na+/H+ antiporter MnhE subunit
MLLQLLVILATSLFFWLFNGTLAFVSVLFGGLISMANNFLISHISNKQQTIKPDNTSVGFALLIYSVISRLIVVALLVLLGFKLNLLPLELLVGLIVGQVVLIINKLRYNKG